MRTIPLAVKICYNTICNMDQCIMKRLWSPWRMNYIKNHIMGENCIFCDSLEKPDNSTNLIIYRGQEAFIILNRYPYTSGHMMTVPYKHSSCLVELTSSERSELFELGNKCVDVLRKTYKAQGFNLGMNIGESGGAGIAQHLHLHIVPRWSGDTNFMSTLAETRVVPESIEETYSRISEAWKAMYGQT